jgi:AraC-like DNA-binding protein
MPQILPLKIDLFALWMFLGVIQGLFLSIFFFQNKKGNRQFNLFFGVLLIAFSLGLAEIVMCYTNYMFKVLWLTDFAEPTNLLYAPCLFLSHKAFLKGKINKADWWHFAPFVLYFIYMCITSYPLPIELKYNGYLNAYHPNLPKLDGNGHLPSSWYIFRRYTNEIMLTQMLIYTAWGIWQIKGESISLGINFWSNQNEKLTWVRKTQFYFILTYLLLLICKLIFPKDSSDHIVGSFITAIIYLISFSILAQNAFFENSQKRRYEKSSLSDDSRTESLKKLEKIMTDEKPFLQNNFSLTILSKSMSISPHHLSQILNESLGQTFFEYIATKRVKESQLLLKSVEHNHIKIEEIAEMVGYNSKSAFNTSFKKITGQTPSEFRAKEQN